MKYGVFSDSHDNFYNLEKAIKLVEERGIKTIFHLGDFCAPGAVRTMTNHKEIEWICIWGNNEGAKAQIVLEQKNNPNFDIAKESFRELEIEGKKIFLVHFPELAKHAAATGSYQAVFYGHDHQSKIEKLDNGTLLADPGEISGMATGQPSFGIWDSQTNEFEIVKLTDFRTTKV